MTDEQQPADPGETAGLETPTERFPVAESTGALDVEATPEPPKKRTPKNKVLISLGVVAGVLALAVGATVVWAVAGSPDAATLSPEPSASSASPIPTLEPEPVQVPVPQPVLALSCQALVPASSLAVMNPEADLAVVDDADFSAELAQAGGTECSWNSTGASGSYDERIFLSILPGAEPDFLASYGEFPQDAYNIVDTVGDHSLVMCNYWGGTGSCQGHVTVRGYWAAVSVNRSAGVVDKEQLDEAMQSLLAQLVTAVRSAPADRPVPAPIVGAFDGQRLCDDIALSEAAFGWSGLKKSGGEGGGWITSYADPRVGAKYCWLESGSNYLSYFVLPSGAWVVDQMVARMPLDGPRGAYSQVEVTGADAVLVACDSSGCDAAMSYGLSRVRVSAWGMDREAFVAGLQKLVASLG